ncbi:biogenesis of lysosome-related organelles complex 1 subunit 6 [Python bivittatus]|uniref:Biogenesis of lysosome-related organelles complex 1 subunit 6 n=1 Tax=Python bivittatus TaxID=176946 RepID=A0A9F5IUJ6_PYTBI|nr:biogenesis of lysosome-related organelles complex 1 subunit 6 [Python bivittatus]
MVDVLHYISIAWNGSFLIEVTLTYKGIPATGRPGEAASRAPLLTPPPEEVLPGSLRLDLNDNSPDEGLIDEFPMIDKKAVEQLTEGLISHYLPDLQRSKLALKELTQNQEVLLETVQQEISKFKECNSILDINMLFSEAKYYHNKLVNIRKEMLLLHEKTSKLKRRALKLQQKRQKEELEREQQREKELEREKQLTAKPAKRT